MSTVRPDFAWSRFDPATHARRAIFRWRPSPCIQARAAQGSSDLANLGVPAGDLTAQEKLRALELTALEASRDGRHDKAEAFARWLVTSADDDLERLDFLLSLGKVLESAGEHGRARDLYEAMLRVHGSDVDVLNRAGWFFLTTQSTRDRDVARGSELARRAASIAPTNPSVLDTHAESKILVGDIEGARGILHRCVALDPGRPYYAKRLESLSSR